jgi:hypothetical protein
MVNVPQVQIPDFAGTILRGEQVQLSRLQAMAQRQALDDASRFDSTLSQIAPALAAGQGPEYDSALGRLMGAGRRGFELALPLQQRRQQQREFDSIMPGAVAAPSVAPVSPVGTAPAGEGGFTLAGLATNTRSESGGDPNARPLFPDGTPRSSSVGPNQFIEGTWLAFANANPNLFQGMSRQQILDARRDPNISAQATQWYARQNAPQLQAAGVPVNDATLGLAHQFDGPVAARIFTAAPNTPIADVVGPAAMRANPDLVGQTTGQVVQRYQQRYAGGGAAPARDPNVTPTSAGAPPAGAPAGRGPNTPGAPSQEVFARAVNLAARGNEAAQRFVAAWGPFMRQADTTDSFREETRNIGGRQVQGQVNARTGQFTPFPGQTGAERAERIDVPTAVATVRRLGPQIASGAIAPDSPEYDDYAIAYEVATRAMPVWVDDPSNPGNQRQQMQPGLVLDPARFPRPPNSGSGPAVGGAPGGGGPMTAPAAATVPAQAAPGNDAAAVGPDGRTRVDPATQPTAGDRTRLRQLEVEAQGVLDAFQAFRDARRNAGLVERGFTAAGIPTPLATAWTNAALLAKGEALFNLGVLNGPDLQIIQRAISDPSTMRGFFTGEATANAQITQIENLIRSRLESARRQYGAPLPPAPQGQTAGPGGRGVADPPPRDAAVDPARRTRAEEAIARARRELGPNATEDAILQRAAGFMR